ncbi:hypothetical protein COV93_02350 [Candidatus Woesearchaeota archaeon CG11_big_fil_rev_8_21_14_0_20_43_8]|nr:MAG: hypothetical protein COV93_02350 [Candidatus Woesearchaeota archaeon CG11_big_fil_rev_8_21_14_0_20_43_8]PIO05340.1 MAG: hypothetical protein COT47_05220 [Candidatus Woesearchaeota archaeon CG08_land_8_20_14_0_20_43_7]
MQIYEMTLDEIISKVEPKKQEKVRAIIDRLGAMALDATDDFVKINKFTERYANADDSIDTTISYLKDSIDYAIGQFRHFLGTSSRISKVFKGKDTDNIKDQIADALGYSFRDIVTDRYLTTFISDRMKDHKQMEQLKFEEKVRDAAIEFAERLGYKDPKKIVDKVNGDLYRINGQP